MTLRALKSTTRSGLIVVLSCSPRAEVDEWYFREQFVCHFLLPRQGTFSVRAVTRTYPLLAERPEWPAAASVLVDCPVPTNVDLRHFGFALPAPATHAFLIESIQETQGKQYARQPSLKRALRGLQSAL